MKKIVTAIATAIIIAGATVTTASAAEYNVEKGDTLWGIAQKYDTTVSELKEANDLKTTVIYPNQRLLINEQNNGLYQVKEGDTLYGIGQANNVSVQELMDWNNLPSSLIVPGQKLSLSNDKASQKATATAEEKEQSSGATDEAAVAESTASEVDTTATKTTETVQTAETTTQQSTDSPQGETMTVTATAYTADCAGCSGITATGVNLNANSNAKVIAVDPDVIPLGTKVFVEGYGYATASDVGGAIQGNKIDVHLPTKSEAYQWGVRKVDVTIIE